MSFNPHYNLEGRHAQLSPSQYSWIRYDDEKMLSRIRTMMAAKIGTEFHELAHRCIRLGVRQIKNTKTFNSFVNDVIGHRMASEQVLYYSDNCFGTADAIGYNKKENLLQIFDLKTGVSKASVDQLLVYAALYCLEYNHKPFDLLYDLRIYQSDEVMRFEVDPVDVAEIMAKIVHFDQLINDTKREEEL